MEGARLGDVRTLLAALKEEWKPVYRSRVAEEACTVSENVTRCSYHMARQKSQERIGTYVEVHGGLELLELYLG